MNKTFLFIVLSLILVFTNADQANQAIKQEATQQEKTSENKSEQQSGPDTVKQAAYRGLIGSGVTLATNAVSSVAISAAGFTTGGIAAGSTAAGIQSGIGLVGAGSSFSFFQAVGALGQGILGAYAVPAVIVVGAGVGGYYLIDHLVNQ